MQLPDEAIDYQYSHAVAPSFDTWEPLTELQATHLLSRERLRTLMPQVMQVRSEMAAEREVVPPPERQPLLAGFIDLPQKMLDTHRRRGELSDLGRILAASLRLRDNTDRVVVLGAGGSYLGGRALFHALSHTYHNELPLSVRMARPRLYFEGNSFDNDVTQDLLELLENQCVDPELPEERWGAVVISKSGATLETATAYRIFRAEAARFYGSQSEWLRDLFVPITGPNTRLRDLCRAEGHQDDDILTIPENVGGPFSVFTAAGLLPAAIVGLDIRALLLGAAAMSRRFLEEPFDQNPVLQFATINYLMHRELNSSTRILSVWSRKLEALGEWYTHLVSESLGKAGKGPQSLTMVQTRDMLARVGVHHDGPRDKFTTNLYIRTAKHPPIPVGHAGERNEDKLNDIARKTLVDLAQSSYDVAHNAAFERARPTADLTLPALTEHSVGQLMQMLMLATVVEGRLMGINPYSRPGSSRHRDAIDNSIKR